MGKIIKQNIPTIVALVAAYFMFNRFIDSARLTVSPITKPVSKALAEIQFFVNGSNYIKREWAGFFLNSAKLDYTLKIRDFEWLHAMTLLHDAHEDFLNEIFDNDLRLKNKYRPLLNGLVDSETIAAANKE